MKSNTWGGNREGAGRVPLQENCKKQGYKIYITEEVKEDINKYGIGKSFSTKVNELIQQEITKRKKIVLPNKIKFIDLFSGMGGLRLGFEQAFQERGYETECVLTSEIKEHAIKVLNKNFKHKKLVGDITQVSNEDIEQFDILLGGFPCQAFSTAGKRNGFLDTRGTLFFEIERILKAKKPYGFILENVEGLITHDKESKNDDVGRTLNTIITSLEQIGYKVTWELLDSQYFGVAQARKRIFIVGTLNKNVKLENFTTKKSVFTDIMETGKKCSESHFTRCLLKSFKPEKLYGKAIKDKRGGDNNIHSWDIGLKGEIKEEQKKILELLFKERRKKHWAKEIGIKWMDGMPLTKKQIETFYKHDELEVLLDDLVNKGYLKLEYPKEQVEVTLDDGNIKKERKYDFSKEKGYNIVTGKLSFEFSKIIDINGITPTLVATDVVKMGVIDGEGIRTLTLREGLRLFGYPEEYKIDFLYEDSREIKKGFDLLGNTVVVPVVKQVALKLEETYSEMFKVLDE